MFWNQSPVSKDGFMSKVPRNQLGMEILYQGGRVDIDIVAVHGLGAIPDTTWKEKTSQTNWLQDGDMLLGEIPNSRIMRFGYDSLWFCKNPVRKRAETISKALLARLQEYRRECRDRPVIFIGHCFGGLLIQKALTLDHRKNDASKTTTLLSITAGIIFLGTPHSGTVTSAHNRISHYSVISLLVATSDLRPRAKGLKKKLESHNTFSDISKEFLPVCTTKYNSVMVINFFDQRSSNVGRLFGRNGVQEFVIGKASATLGHYPSYGIPLDHYNLNKFVSPEDGNFKLVLGQIKEIYSRSLTKTAELSQTTSEQPSYAIMQPRSLSQDINTPQSIQRLSKQGSARSSNSANGSDVDQVVKGEKVVAIRTRIDKSTRKLRRDTTIVLTLVPIFNASASETRAVVWKVLSYNAEVSKSQTCTWKNEAGFCAIDEKDNERIKPKRPRKVVAPGQSVRLVTEGETGKENNELSEPESGNKTGNITIVNETGDSTVALYTIDKTRPVNDQDCPVLAISLQENGMFDCSLPVLLQAYALSGFEERQIIETHKFEISGKALFLKNGQPRPIDIRELGERTTFTLYSDHNNKIFNE